MFHAAICRPTSTRVAFHGEGGGMDGERLERQFPASFPALILMVRLLVRTSIRSLRPRGKYWGKDEKEGPSNFLGGNRHGLINTSWVKVQLFTYQGSA